MRETGRSLQNLNILYHSIRNIEIATVSVPSWTVGRIVGNNGGVIWRIGQKSGCKCGGGGSWEEQNPSDGILTQCADCQEDY